ncbi:MAG TPA: protein kinase [Thermoanaerobaculia bacterium]|nr:protein kinase [Thermoanaerobaculia bacterium]
MRTVCGASCIGLSSLQTGTLRYTLELVNPDRSAEESQKVGPYRLERPIASGGMGTVWQAWDERLRRPVAIKQVLSVTAVPHARKRLQREARAVARLNHPAIVHVYDLVEQDDGDWIVMEFIEGQTLRELMEARPMTTLQALQLGCAIAEGLAEAHRNGILHRDLKAANVMLTPSGQVKILDFGLAKELSSESSSMDDLSLSVSGTILGTCHAMSPEQAMGLELDARSDLFSLGSLLYELLSGVMPFRGANPQESLAKVMNADPIPLQEVRADVPRPVLELVAQLLRKERSERPRSAEIVARRLSGLIAVLTPGSVGPAEHLRELNTLALPASSGETTFIESPPWLRGAPDPGSDRHLQPAEHRRITVVCCGLSETAAMDMRAIQERARDLAEQFSGCMGAVLGRMLWLYFGYPQAHEDDPQRAVRVACLLLERIGPPGTNRARIAIHTGPAVVALRPDRTVELQLGPTLDLVTALQESAPPDSVVVSTESSRLISRAFSLEPLAQRPGVDDSSSSYRVIAPLDLRHESGLGGEPLVGREQELTLLLDRFRLVRSGTGQAVMISGEAGIGKSRLVQALRQGLANENLSWLVAYGSPYTQSSPLAPIVELLQRMIFGAAAGPSDRKLIQIEDLFRRYGVPLQENIPVLASLLGVSAEDRYPPLTMTPDVRREQTLELLVELLSIMAERTPIVLVIEDLHWIDPSTIELLQLLVRDIAAVPLLLVGTLRPEFQISWRAQISQISLTRLTDGETAAMIDRLAAERDLPDWVRRQIVAKTDGVPLFIEELTKAVLEARWSGEELNIPSTLDGSLMARLDRLGEAKGVAQLASVIGRVFHLDLLAAVAPFGEEALRSGLEELLQAELIHRRGTGSRARYLFKHALIQDAAYLSLLKEQRQQIHERIALVLEERLNSSQDGEPEILAYHFERAGRVQEAISYLQQAALRSIQRSAFSEALSHGRKGIELLDGLPPSPWVLEQELALRSILSVALVPARGYASQEVEENAARSRALCQEFEDSPRLIPALYGLWVYHLLRGQKESSRELSEEIGRLARDHQEQVFISFSSRGITAFWAGEIERSTALLESAMEIYNPDLHPVLAQTYGDESGLLPHFYHFWCLWLLGRPDEALRRMREAMEIVQGLPSPYVRVTGLMFEMVLWHALRRPEEVRRVAEQFVALAREQRFPFFLALARCGYGWTMMHRGDPEEGIAEIREALENHRAIGTRLARPYWLIYLIEVYLSEGRFQEGLEAVEDALTASASQLDICYDAELNRLGGELRLRLSDPEGAEAAFRKALEIAASQGSRMQELRAATSLARLLRDQGRAGEAKPLLASVYGAFQEGWDTPDLLDARQLLDELG